MTDAERKVMQIFRFYGVAAYQMLCLNGKVQDVNGGRKVQRATGNRRSVEKCSAHVRTR